MCISFNVNMNVKSALQILKLGEKHVLVLSLLSFIEKIDQI